ncbi:MAG: N-acetyltransferase family protein [Desulfomicrobium sp.]
MSEILFRDRVREDDRQSVREIVTSTAFFSEVEVDVAEELVAERLVKGEESGYFFVFAESRQGQVLGYACYGPTPCTASTFDLYWVAVRESMRGQGLGKMLLREVEDRLEGMGGGKLIAETSSREQYAPTHRFYLACGFEQEARIGDYYAPGEDILYFTKKTGRGQARD